MQGRRKPGTQPKGDRKAVTARVPTDQYLVYEEAARNEGYACLSDYIGACLARAHNLPVPSYTGRRRRGDPQGSLPIQLPMAM